MAASISAGRDHPRRRGEYLGARRARGGNHHGGAFQIEGGAHEIGHRIGVVGGAIVEVVGQGAGCRVAAAIGLFGLQDAGGAGAEQNADPPPAVAGGSRADGGIEAILAQAQQGEAVVAALVLGKTGRQRRLVDAGHFTDMGRQVGYRLEGAGREPALLRTQGSQRRIQAVAKAACGGEVGKPERIQQVNPSIWCALIINVTGAFLQIRPGIGAAYTRSRKDSQAVSPPSIRPPHTSTATCWRVARVE